MSDKSQTPRTDALSLVVQNQNWGFRDMQLLALKLELELTALQSRIERLTKLGNDLDASIKEYQTATMAKGLRIIMLEDENDKDALECANKMPDETELRKWAFKASQQMRKASEAWQEAKE